MALQTHAALHVSWAVRNRRYDPGLVTAMGMLGPTAVIGLRALYGAQTAPRSAIAAGLLTGLAVSMALPALLKRRRCGIIAA